MRLAQILESARERAMDAGDEENVEDSDRYLAQLEVTGRAPRPRQGIRRGRDRDGRAGGAELGLSGQLFARALVAAHEGDTDLARKHTARGLSMAEELGDENWAILQHCVLGFLELSLGNPGEALSHLEPLPARLERLGIRGRASLGRFYPKRTRSRH